MFHKTSKLRSICLKFMEVYDKYFQKVLYRIHLHVFKSQPGDTTKRFIENLFYAFFGVGGATLITFGFNVLAIRYLGPTEFGKWNLISSIAELFVILPLWGLSTASLRYLATEREKQEEIVGTSFRVVFLLTLLFFPLYLLLSPVLQNFLKINASLYSFAIIYAVALIFFYLFRSFLQGLERFRKLSFLQIASALVFVFSVSVYLFYFRKFSYDILFWSNVWQLLLIVFVGVFIFGKMLVKFNTQIFKEVFHYGTFQMLSVFAGFFSLGSIDNLMINYFLGPTAVGLYAAYYICFNIFIGKILNTFSQVFLPAASGVSNIKILFDRLLIFMKKMGALILAGNFLLIWLLFTFYGNKFTFDWQLAVLMALSITLYCFLTILGNIIATSGIPGARIGAIFAFSAAILNVTLNAILIPRYQLFGAVIATIIVTLTVMIAAIYFIKVKLIRDVSY